MNILMEEMHRARNGDGAWTSMPSPGMPHSRHISYLEALRTLFFWVFMEASLVKSLAIGW